MPSTDDSTPPFKSQYPVLVRPDFKPNVPGFLLEGATDQDRYIIESLSLVNQYAQWSVNTEMSTHEQVLATNGRLMRAEKGIRDTQEDVNLLKDQARVVTPFLKPISMFATLWEYWAFKWLFVGGIVFFLFVLYPYLLQCGLLTLLDSYLKGH